MRRVRHIIFLLLLCHCAAFALSFCIGRQFEHDDGLVFDAELYPVGFGGFNNNYALFHGVGLNCSFNSSQTYTSVLYGAIFLRNTIGFSGFIGPTVNFHNMHEAGGSLTLAFCPVSTIRFSMSLVHDFEDHDEKLMLRVLGGLSLPIPLLTKRRGEQIGFMARPGRAEQ